MRKICHKIFKAKLSLKKNNKLYLIYHKKKTIDAEIQLF